MVSKMGRSDHKGDLFAVKVLHAFTMVFAKNMPQIGRFGYPGSKQKFPDLELEQFIRFHSGIHKKLMRVICIWFRRTYIRQYPEISAHT